MPKIVRNETEFCSGPSTLAGLGDTNINNPSNGQLLKYNNSTHKWENYEYGYHAGETISLSTVLFLGIQTTNTKDFRFFIPLDKPLASDVRSVSISGGFDVRHSDGVRIFSDTFQNLGTVTINAVPTGIYIRLVTTDAVTTTNNAPIVAYGSSTAALTFNAT